ncbi:hypothetical protein GUITHDRAFT_111508 [Guillardia theta CCMP2712]|uniref:Uncharacterized protein n=1 Tax=Guillardia theta (strain CCMP2712) TaxID=905079 RepID=L1J364_GUITC|nr:hypothetical protein GUITHDRAFT_111508 [Guillardia theta CCMP2712]EKX42535.1 hypothetical protein GUITHDRAFT_111508 [Guillardia theta CCMP2712]|eukprot:XP_005829515.1 hypothetical protein GUITHDRAFT_111508 [Guillardia theta CCMP2712]
MILVMTGEASKASSSGAKRSHRSAPGRTKKPFRRWATVSRSNVSEKALSVGGPPVDDRLKNLESELRAIQAKKKLALSQITAMRRELSSQDASQSVIELQSVHEPSAGHIGDVEELYSFLHEKALSFADSGRNQEGDQSLHITDLSSVKGEQSTDLSRATATAFSEEDAQSWLQPVLTAKSYLSLIKSLGFHYHIEKGAALFAFSMWARSNATEGEDVKSEWRLTFLQFCECIKDMLEASEISSIGSVQAHALKAMIKRMKGRLSGNSSTRPQQERRSRGKSQTKTSHYAFLSQHDSAFKGSLTTSKLVKHESTVEWELWKLMKQSGLLDTDMEGASGRRRNPSDQLARIIPTVSSAPVFSKKRISVMFAEDAETADSSDTSRKSSPKANPNGREEDETSFRPNPEYWRLRQEFAYRKTAIDLDAH